MCPQNYTDMHQIFVKFMLFMIYLSRSDVYIYIYILCFLYRFVMCVSDMYMYITHIIVYDCMPLALFWLTVGGAHGAIYRRSVDNVSFFGNTEPYTRRTRLARALTASLPSRLHCHQGLLLNYSSKNYSQMVGCIALRGGPSHDVGTSHAPPITVGAT